MAQHQVASGSDISTINISRHYVDLTFDRRGNPRCRLDGGILAAGKSADLKLSGCRGRLSAGGPAPVKGCQFGTSE